MSDPLGKVISKPSGRRLVIGDIHGCVDTLKELIRQLKLQSDDHIYFLGDYVNKGPKSRAVVDYLLSLKENYSVFPLLGNHDLIVLEYLESKSAQSRRQLIDLKNEDFLDLNGQEEKYLNFFRDLPYYFILDHFILVHAGLDFSLANPFLDKNSLITIREFYYDSSRAQGKTIVHGHYPYKFDYIKQQLKENQKILPLDNGCVYTDREGQGNLLCLDLDRKVIWQQPNIDQT